MSNIVQPPAKTHDRKFACGCDNGCDICAAVQHFKNFGAAEHKTTALSFVAKATPKVRGILPEDADRISTIKSVEKMLFGDRHAKRVIVDYDPEHPTIMIQEIFN